MKKSIMNLEKSEIDKRNNVINRNQSLHSNRSFISNLTYNPNIQNSGEGATPKNVFS